MAHLSNCTNCLYAKEDCARRDALRAGLKGLSVTSVKFICRDRKPMFAVGQRVSVWWPVDSGCTDDWGRADFTQETWPATVVAERGNRFQIVVDDVESDNETPARDYIKSETLYCKVPAWRLSLLDEPSRTVCDVCQQVASDGVVKGCWTETDDPSTRYDYRPTNCLARILASVDTHPKGGDAVAAPFMGSAVRKAQTPNPLPHSHAEAKQPVLSRTDADAHPSTPGIRPTSSTGAE